jgi:hypothetical protein
MTPNDFVQQHGTKQFRHSEELLSIVARSDCSLNASDPTDDHAPCRNYLGIYRRRVKHLRAFNTQHAISIGEDCEALCRELEQTPEEPCRLWIFKSSIREFVIFEGVVTQRILGCISAVDKREVDEAAWEKLWGK